MSGVYVPHNCSYCGVDQGTQEGLTKHLPNCSKRPSQTGKRKPPKGKNR